MVMASEVGGGERRWWVEGVGVEGLRVEERKVEEDEELEDPRREEGLREGGRRRGGRREEVRSREMMGGTGSREGDAAGDRPFGDGFRFRGDDGVRDDKDSSDDNPSSSSCSSSSSFSRLRESPSCSKIGGLDARIDSGRMTIPTEG